MPHAFMRLSSKMPWDSPSKQPRSTLPSWSPSAYASWRTGFEGSFGNLTCAGAQEFKIVKEKLR